MYLRFHHVACPHLARTLYEYESEYSYSVRMPLRVSLLMSLAILGRCLLQSRPTVSRTGHLRALASKPANFHSPEELQHLTVVQLKEELSKHGMRVSGKKDVLIQRLAEGLDLSQSISSTVTSGNGPAVMVVESPAKCKTIAKFAGSDYIVLASYGHVRRCC